jgi:hypothetical protein
VCWGDCDRFHLSFLPFPVLICCWHCTATMALTPSTAVLTPLHGNIPQAGKALHNSTDSTMAEPVDWKSIELKQEEIEEYRATFQVFDKDGSGAIDAQELKQLFESINEPVPG